MKERLYRGFWDDGHDTGEFEFYSKHRAGSKANLEDAYNSYKKHYGYSRYKAIKITSVYLV